MVSDGTDPVDVLLVENDPGDALMAREALGQAGAHSRLHVATTGEDALRFLHREGEFARAPRPGLILLDLSLHGLHGLHGLDVLARLKSEPDLQAIPVVVLSSSSHPDDIQHSYELQASAYIVKPADFDGLADVIRQIAACFPASASHPLNRPLPDRGSLPELTRAYQRPDADRRGAFAGSRTLDAAAAEARTA